MDDDDEEEMDEDHPKSGAVMDNDKHLPDEDKHTLKIAKSAHDSPNAEPNKGSHDQGSDTHGKTSGDEKLKGKGDKSAGKMPASHDQGSQTLWSKKKTKSKKRKRWLKATKKSI